MLDLPCQLGDDPGMPLRGAAAGQERPPCSHSLLLQGFGIVQQPDRLLCKIRRVRDLYACADRFQERLGIQEVLHEGTIEDGLSPGGGFQRVLPAQGHKTASTEIDRPYAIKIEKLPKRIDQHHGVCPLCIAQIRPQMIPYAARPQHGRDRRRSDHVAGSDDQDRLREPAQDPLIDVQNHLLFTGSGASRDDDHLGRSEIQEVSHVH